MIKYYWDILIHYILVFGPYVCIVWSAWTYYCAFRLKKEIDQGTAKGENNGATCIWLFVWATVLLISAIRLFFY